jgi:peptidoglycan/LPS O-acetylase OafA/YrhL
MLLGSALAIAVRSPRGLAAWPRWGVFLALPLLVVAVCIDYSQSRLLFLGTTLWTLVWTAALAYLLAAPRNAHIAHFFNQAWLKNLGKLSYGMYVFQSPMIPLLTPGLVVLSGLVAPRHSVSGHLFHMVVLCAATYVMAWFSWHGFEKHWLRLKRGFPGAPQQISAVSSDSEAVSQVQSSLGQMALKGQDRQENRNFLAFFSVFLTKS